MKNAIYDFLMYEEKVLNRSHDHLKHHKYVLEKFYEYQLYKQKEIWMSLISVSDVNEYLIHIKWTPILFGPNKWWERWQNTLATYCNSLRQFFKRWKKLWKKWINRESIPLIQKERKTMDWCKPEEYKILRTAPQLFEHDKLVILRNRLLIDIPYHTGLRRAEVLRCKFEMFFSPTNQFEILGKWWYVDWVCFDNEIKLEVEEYFNELNKKNLIDKSSLMFFSLSNHNFGNKMNEKSVNLIFTKYSELLIKKWLLSRVITPHMERHSFATNCVLSGLSQQATTKLMRHRNPTTTLRYYHLDNKRVKSEYDKIKFE